MMVKSENLEVFCEYVIIFITFIYFSKQPLIPLFALWRDCFFNMK